MRYILYFLVYSVVVMGLFITLLYLMTVVDPGLMQLPEKAVRMMQANSDGLQDSAGELPSDMYIDFTELLNRSRNVLPRMYDIAT